MRHMKTAQQIMADQREGARLQYWRKQRGMSQEAMALAVGISEASYRRHEQGKAHIRNDVVIAYCKLLKVRFDQIRITE